MPATGTAAEPMPATKIAPANRRTSPAVAATMYAARLIAAPPSSTGRAPNRSTRIPVGISATADPSPTAANTAPKPAGPRSNWSRTSSPIAGSPNCTTETAACATTARISVVRARLFMATR